MIKIRFRLFVPDVILSFPAVQRSIIRTMARITAPELHREFNKTTVSWSDRPNFHRKFYFGEHRMWTMVLTYRVKYRLVNAGARPHIILPRRAKMLRFQTSFKAKSRPRVIKAFAGGKSGPYISSLGVQHPGHEAREFDKTIAEEYQDTFNKDIQEAIVDGIIHR